LMSVLEPRKFTRGAIGDEDWLEILTALEEVARLWRGDLVIVEVGVLDAKTSRGLLEAATALGVVGEIICIDKEESARRAWFRRCRDFAGSAKSRFIKARSAEASSEVSHAHMVFLDACHCAECVTKDINLWGPKVVIGGRLLVHDTDESNEGREIYPPYHDNDGVARVFGAHRVVRRLPYLLQAFDLVRHVPTQTSNPKASSLSHFVRNGATWL
jgi:hypothetical protein